MSQLLLPCHPDTPAPAPSPSAAGPLGMLHPPGARRGSDSLGGCVKPPGSGLWWGGEVGSWHGQHGRGVQGEAATSPLPGLGTFLFPGTSLRSTSPAVTAPGEQRQLPRPFTDSLLPLLQRPSPGTAARCGLRKAEESLPWPCCPQSYSCHLGCSCPSRLQGHLPFHLLMNPVQSLVPKDPQVLFYRAASAARSLPGCPMLWLVRLRWLQCLPDGPGSSSLCSMSLQLCRSRRSLPSAPEATDLRELVLGSSAPLALVEGAFLLRQKPPV